MVRALLDEAVKPNIETAIRRTVEEQFGAENVHAVEVSIGEDPFGEPLYTVKAILTDQTDFRKIGDGGLGLIRNLRRALEREGDSTFPLVRMMSRRDAEFLARESR